MSTILWIPATLAASVLQVGRNALQRGLLPKSGPWAATLVRFLFGLPFSLLLALAAYVCTPGAALHFSSPFWLNTLSGAVSQVLATACLLVAMRRAGFAVGTSMQQSSLPLAAILGLLFFHDQLHALAGLGVALTSAALLVLTWPRQAGGPQPVSGGVFGLPSGLCFGYSLNAYRQAVNTDLRAARSQTASSSDRPTDWKAWLTVTVTAAVKMGWPASMARPAWR